MSGTAISNVEALQEILESLKTIMASLPVQMMIVEFYDLLFLMHLFNLFSWNAFVYRGVELTPLFSSDKYIHGLFTYALTLHIQTFQVKILKESILLLFTTLNIPSHATCPMKVK